MKQIKIVINVQMSCHKLKTKAMEIASVADGVTSIAISGGENDQLVVIGESVDPVKLTSSIRKKISRNANLILVEEVKPKDDQKPTNQQTVYYPPPAPAYTYETVVYNPYGPYPYSW